MTNQPVMVPNQETGAVEPIFADPNMPEELWPVGPDGVKLKIAKTPSITTEKIREGPQLSLRPYESILFPPGSQATDPNDWDYIVDKFTVTPYWFLGKEGDPFEGKLQNIDKLWRILKIDPNMLHLKPDQRLFEPINLCEVHFKFPATQTGKPVELIAIIDPEHNLLLGWRVSPFHRRPYFHRLVWSRDKKEQSPHGKGIPETIWGLRNALDANLNQDLDAGNLYNHPPLLLSSLAMLEDEDYEMVGPGTQWVMQDINGAKFLPPPISKRDPLAMENWLFSMAQRVWSVTDLNLNAPTSSLSPNVSTATGVVSVLNQGNIKYGHLTKRLSVVDTKEYQFCHEMFRTMLANPRMISVKGKPIVIGPEDREQFFRRTVRIVAVGNGVTTNPTLRQQIFSNLYQIFVSTQNPFVIGDLEVYKELTDRLQNAFGANLSLKDPQILQDLTLIQRVLQTQNGRARIAQAVQESVAELQAAQQLQQQGQGVTNGSSAIVQ